MAPGNSQDAPTHAQPAVAGPAAPYSAARALETLGFFVLLLVVAMRPLLSETYDSQRTPIDVVTGMPEVTTPATTAWFDLAVWVSALAWAAGACLRGRRWRWTGVELGFALLVGAAVISTWTASNRRLALNASCDWLTCLVLLMTTAQWARQRWRGILILIVVVASGVAAAARCGMQKGVEFRETQALYEQDKENFWRDQGVDPNDPQARLYERRLAAREASGFFPFSNVQGIGLALAGFAALACIGAVRRRAPRRLIGWIIAGLLFAAIVLTGSIGAVLASVVGLMLWWVLGRWRAAWKQRWLRTWLVGWLLAGAGVAALVMIGHLRGGLPGASLNFRWQYWTATWQIIQDTLWTGTGALNFDRTYLAYKPIEYPEEIRDPHNALLSITAQWGLLGAVGWIACLLGASWVWLRRAVHLDAHQPAVSIAQKDHTSAILYAVTMMPAFLALRFILHQPLWQSGPSGRAFVLFDLGFYGLLWCFVVLVLAWLVTKAPMAGSQTNAAENQIHQQAGADRLAIACGLIAFLLHNVISFSMFYPGTLTVFAALGGLLLARPEASEQPHPRRIAHAAPLLVGFLAFAAFCAAVLVPVTRSTHWLRKARHTIGANAVRAYERAAAADPLDPTPAVGQTLYHAAQRQSGSLTRALKALRVAILRDPEQLKLYRYRAQLLSMRYEQGGATSDLLAAIGAARFGISLYPESPRGHLELAALLHRAARDWQSARLRRQALAAYRRAIRLNAARPGREELRRWSDEMVADIRHRISELRELSMTRPAQTKATQPRAVPTPEPNSGQ